ADVDRRFFGGPVANATRDRIVERMLPYIERELTRGVPLKAMTRHMLGLFQAVPGAKLWRRHLSENAHHPAAGPEVVEKALALARRQATATAA
ncbi:MAG: tRNA-dihydrouridine synthase, partial [Rhodospirillaceae bacterium]